MSEIIPQSFKVEWLNTTLKFIKNDNQMIIKYPEMPVSHVEYLHNLIWQRKNDVGLGFKSLYAPLWEAMKIFSLKYRFKVSVMKSKDATTGHLIIEKILKNKDQENEKVDKTAESENQDNNSTHSVPEQSINKKINKKKTSKSEKYYLDKCKIIESLSPLFIKASLQKILDFINTESEASLILTDLAPMEARFLENFLGIYNRRNVFKELLSPACNDILLKMLTSFKTFDKTCKLEVGGIETNLNTKKRELTFIKVPRYTRSTRSMLAKGNAENAQSSTDTNENSKWTSFNTLTHEDNISTRQVNVNNETNNFRISVKNNPFQTKIESKSPENRVTDNQEIDNTIDNLAKDKTKLNEVNSLNKSEINKLYNERISDTINSTTHKDKNEKSIDTQEKSIKNIAIDITTLADEKNNLNKSELTENSNTETGPTSATDKRIPITNTDNTTRKDIIGTDNIEAAYSVKGLLSIDNNTKLSNSVKDNTIKDISRFLKDPNKKKISTSKKGIIFEKATGCFDKIDQTQDIIRQEIDKKARRCPRNNKILEAMSVPLESDKAMRMMQLMGWRGGALGLRGEGITEPIMPIMSRSPGAGLGHVSERFVRKQTKIDLCTKIMENILIIIEEDISVCIIPFDKPLTKKERRLLKNTLMCFNYRLKVALPKGVDNDLTKKILDRMISDPCFDIDLSIATDNKEIMLKKINIPEREPRLSKKKTNIETECSMQTSTDVVNIDSNKLQLPEKKTDFKILILTRIIQFLECEEKTTNINFDSVIRMKYCKFVEKTCNNINKRIFVQAKVIKHLFVKILQIIDKTYLDVKLSADKMSFIIKKIYYKNRFVNSAINNSSSGNNDRNVSDRNSNENTATNERIGATLVENDEKLATTKEDSELNDDSDIEISDSKDYNINNIRESETSGLFNQIDATLIKNNENLAICNEHLDIIDDSNEEESDSEVLNIENVNKYENSAMLNRNVLNSEDKGDSFGLISDRNKIIENNCDNNSTVENITLEKVQEYVDFKAMDESVKSKDANNNKSHVVKNILQDDLSLNDMTTIKDQDTSVEIYLNTDSNKLNANETQTSKEFANKLNTFCDNNFNRNVSGVNTSNEANSNKIFDSKLIKDKVRDTINIIIIEKVNRFANWRYFFKTVQNLIAKEINEGFIPLLKCHGFYKREIIYTCHNKNSYLWLKEVLRDFKVTDYTVTTDNKYTLNININTIFDSRHVLDLLEMCNAGLSCKNWIVLETKYSNCLILVVFVDYDSFKYVFDNNFKLSVGIDEAEFSIRWPS